MAPPIWILLKNMDQLDEMEINGNWRHPEGGEDREDAIREWAWCSRDEAREWRARFDPLYLIVNFTNVDECGVCGNKYRTWYNKNGELGSACYCVPGLYENRSTGKKCLVESPDNM